MPHNWKYVGEFHTGHDHYRYECQLCGYKVYSLYEPPDPDRKVNSYHDSGRFITCEEKQVENIHQS